MMIFDRDQSASVVYIDREDAFVETQIAEQLSEALNEGEPMHVRMRHRSIDVSSCSGLIDRLAEFRAQLAVFDPRSRRTATPELPEIVVDAPGYRIVMSAPDAVVTIELSGALDPPLQQAAGLLHSVVSRCAGSVTPRVRRHAF